MPAGLGRRIPMMIGGLIQIGAGLGMLALMMLGAHVILDPARGLKGGLFRPWRADPWPRGVQEEEPVRFDLAGAERRRRERLAPHYPPIEETPSARASTTVQARHRVGRRLRH